IPARGGGTRGAGSSRQSVRVGADSCGGAGRSRDAAAFRKVAETLLVERTGVRGGCSCPRAFVVESKSEARSAGTGGNARRDPIGRSASPGEPFRRLGAGLFLGWNDRCADHGVVAHWQAASDIANVGDAVQAVAEAAFGYCA